MLTYRFQEDAPQTGRQMPPYHGSLQLQVKTESGQNLPDAHVQIVREASNDLMYDLTTDSGGKTKTVLLPTPQVTTTYGPSNEIYYTNYIVTLNHPGYYTTIYKSVSIYDGSTSNLIVKIIAAR